MTQSLTVLMNGIIVGMLIKDKAGGLSFSYDANWLTWSDARPLSLSLPLLGKHFSGDVVYNFFDNLLPDNTTIRARIQTKFQTQTSQPFDLLAAIGKDCVGAIQLCKGVVPFEKDIQAKLLSDIEIAAILNAYREAPLGMSDTTNDFRISIAGVQEKSAFLLKDGKWARPLGSTPTSHIFKLPIGLLEPYGMNLMDSCENEWLCSQIAAAFGLPVAKPHIHYFAGVKVLVVERFDRQYSKGGRWLMRLPQEDVCQALGVSPNLKYQGDGGPGIAEIMNLLLGSEDASTDRDQFFRSQILFCLLAAIDGHAKNFSIFLKPKGHYRLTPLYDIMSAHPLLNKHQLQTQKIKMAMALRGKNNHYHWHKLQRRHFISTARHANYSPQRAEEILFEMLAQVGSVIAHVSKILPEDFPKDIALPLFQGMLSMKSRLEN